MSSSPCHRHHYHHHHHHNYDTRHENPSRHQCPRRSNKLLASFLTALTKSLASAHVSMRPAYRFRSGTIPVGKIKVNSCAPVGVLCGVYSSLKTYRCRSARCTTPGVSRDIHVGEMIWWVTKAVQMGFLLQRQRGPRSVLRLLFSLPLPFERAGLRGGLESDDAGVLFLEQSEGVLVAVVDDTSAWRQSSIGRAPAGTDPANNSFSLWTS